MLFTQSIFAMVFAMNIKICFSFYIRPNHSESSIVFPDTNEAEIQEIPLNLIRQINKLSSVEDFVNNMVNSGELDLMDRMGYVPLEKSLSNGGKTGKCSPEYTTVSLQPNQTSTFYYPRCVKVKRCGGCCLHDLFSCKPLESEFVSVTVAIAEYKGGHYFHLREKRIIQVEQHLKCECGCKIQSQDCTKYQRYNADNCRCECPNNEDAKKCHNKIWNPEVCSCMCRNEITCGTGFEFDVFTCRYTAVYLIEIETRMDLYTDYTYSNRKTIEVEEYKRR